MLLLPPVLRLVASGALRPTPLRTQLSPVRGLLRLLLVQHVEQGRVGRLRLVELVQRLIEAILFLRS